VRREFATRNVSEGFFCKAPIPRSRILKLRFSGQGEINSSKTRGIITTRSVSEGFTVTLRKTQKHNPSLTQRVGMGTNAQLQKFTHRVVISGNYFGTGPQVCTISHARATLERQIGKLFSAGRLTEGPIIENEKRSPDDFQGPRGNDFQETIRSSNSRTQTALPICHPAAQQTFCEPDAANTRLDLPQRKT
jgi:hypothetical protein